MRDGGGLALFARTAIRELLVETMRAEKTRVGPEEQAPCAMRTRFALGERDELSRKAAPAHVVADVDAVQLGRLGPRVIEAHASSDASRAILDDPEAPASFSRARGGVHGVGESGMRVGAG